MKHFLWLFLLGAGYAQIVAGPSTGGGGQCTATGTAACNAPSTANANIQLGDTIIAALTSNVNTSNPSIGGCNQSWPAANRFTGTSFTGVIWIIPHATAAATNCQVTVPATTVYTAFAWHVWSNVLSVGTPAINNTSATGTTMSTLPATASNAGSFIVGILFHTTASNAPITAVAPTTSRRNAAGSAGLFMGDITATSAGQQITISATPNISSTYRSATVELIPTPTNRVAAQSDQMHTVLMNAPRNMNYELHPSDLSPTWCTWFMPIRPYAYALDPQDPHQLNGQAADLQVPAWQMTRVCQDASGNYWASPPLLAGTGISITGAANGVTIAATGGGGGGVSGMTYIAGGTTHIPGTVAVPADTCQTIYTSDGSTNPSASGVQQSDVVSFSLQPSASGWNNGKTFFHPIAYAGSVSWRACNTDTTSYTPSARDVNWYVARPSAGAFRARHKVATRHKAPPAKKVVRPTK